MWERGVTLASEGADLLLTVADKGGCVPPDLGDANESKLIS
ncbi:hypothetical protein FHT92_003503 [Rhizobium sp. BK377]|jgi:hypothetical protein|nr:hypothetical protein [Rhizobium sp. BK377]